MYFPKLIVATATAVVAFVDSLITFLIFHGITTMTRAGMANPDKRNLPPTYTSTIITSDDYSELVSENAPVSTVAVGTVLLAYNWSTKSERYQRVNHFVHAFFSHLKEIKPRRPKWRNFDISASVPGWTRFPGAEQWLKKAELTPKHVRGTAQERVPLDRKALEALFRDLAKYQKTHRVIVGYRDTAADH